MRNFDDMLHGASDELRQEAERESKLHELGRSAAPNVDQTGDLAQRILSEMMRQVHRATDGETDPEKMDEGKLYEAATSAMASGIIAVALIHNAIAGNEYEEVTEHNINGLVRMLWDMVNDTSMEQARGFIEYAIKCQKGRK